MSEEALHVMLDRAEARLLAADSLLRRYRTGMAWVDFDFDRWEADLVAYCDQPPLFQMSGDELKAWGKK